MPNHHDKPEFTKGPDHQQDHQADVWAALSASLNHRELKPTHPRKPAEPSEKDVSFAESKIDRSSAHRSLPEDMRKAVEKLEDLIFKGKQDELIKEVQKYKANPEKLAAIAEHVNRELEPYGLNVGCKLHTNETYIAEKGRFKPLIVSADLVINDNDPAGYQLTLGTNGRNDIQHTGLLNDLTFPSGKLPNVLKDIGRQVVDNIDHNRTFLMIRSL